MSELTEKSYASLSSIFNDTLTGISWVFSLPIRVAAWSILTIRRRRYDPEKVVCPGCGYRGERGSSYKTCQIQFTPTNGPEQAAIGHSCLRCNAPYFTPLFRPAKDWINISFQDRAAKVRATIAKGEL